MVLGNSGLHTTALDDHQFVCFCLFTKFCTWQTKAFSIYYNDFKSFLNLGTHQFPIFLPHIGSLSSKAPLGLSLGEHTSGKGMWPSSYGAVGLQCCGSCPALVMDTWDWTQVTSCSKFFICYFIQIGPESQSSNTDPLTYSSWCYYIRFLILMLPMNFYVYVKLCSLPSTTTIILW